jgi:hypothetical protein
MTRLRTRYAIFFIAGLTVGIVWMEASRAYHAGPLSVAQVGRCLSIGP